MTMQNNHRPGDPPPPPEAATWNIERPSPDVLAWASQTFDMEEYLAGVREIEAGGGFKLEEFIDEIARIANGNQ